MFKDNRFIGLILILTLVITGLALTANADMVWAQEDIEGSKDHELISRFPNSYIVYYTQKDFDEYTLPLGYLDDGELTESKELTGKVTRIQYNMEDENKSTLEIYHNFETALKDAGFEIIFSATDEELHWRWTSRLYGDINQLGKGGHYVGSEDDVRYLSAEYISEDEEIYVSFCVTESRYLAYQLDIIEVEPMETGLVDVKAGAISREISERGTVSIHDIYFETDKAELKPESESALEEIVEFLNNEPEINLFVVGHTDIQGDFDHNMELSSRRAEAVVDALVDFGINEERLNPYGVGPLVPTNNNDTKEGRAENRRVELVKMIE
ncbi:MAG: OmpA family protein [Halanaerobium sp.]